MQRPPSNGPFPARVPFHGLQLGGFRRVRRTGWGASSVTPSASALSPGCVRPPHAVANSPSRVASNHTRSVSHTLQTRSPGAVGLGTVSAWSLPRAKSRCVGCLPLRRLREESRSELLQVVGQVQFLGRRMEVPLPSWGGLPAFRLTSPRDFPPAKRVCVPVTLQAHPSAHPSASSQGKCWAFEGSSNEPEPTGPTQGSLPVAGSLTRSHGQGLLSARPWQGAYSDHARGQ